jgi:hypothetical protein
MRTTIILAAALIACGGKTSGDVVGIDAATADSATDGRSDTAIDFAARSQPGTCVLSANGCCGTCGTPRLSDFTPVNVARISDFRAFTCTDPAPTCPGCASMDDPNLQAFCRGGRCTGVDVRVDALSGCATDDDCLLRYEACCECGASGDFNIVALRRDKAGAYSAERCPPSTGCPECAPAYPTNMRAVCDPTTKHCRVQTI